MEISDCKGTNFIDPIAGSIVNAWSDAYSYIKEMKQLIEDLYLKRRDLVSAGFDEALEYIGRQIPLKILRYSSGTECWTWKVPERWSVREAYIATTSGQKLLDLKDHPLHVISYSLPINRVVSREELLTHIHTRPDRPNAIPYEFKYYERDWGFCLQHEKLPQFTESEYRVLIDSSFEPSNLSVGECLIKGKTEETIALVAHLCHPGQANDDLSGVAVLVDLAKGLAVKKPHFTYRLLFVPETIGSIAYLSQNEKLVPGFKAGIFLEMLGNNQPFALQHTLQGKTYLDRVAQAVLATQAPNHIIGPFRSIVGNDEMAFNGPGVDVPMISLSRAKPGFPHYPEYHTSDDTPAIITEERLVASRDLVLAVLRVIEEDYVPQRLFKGPVFLSRYGLWVDWRNNKKLNQFLEQIMLRLEGRQSVFEIAEELGMEFSVVKDYLDKFVENGLIRKLPLVWR